MFHDYHFLFFLRRYFSRIHLFKTQRVDFCRRCWRSLILYSFDACHTVSLTFITSHSNLLRVWWRFFQVNFSILHVNFFRFQIVIECSTVFLQQMISFIAVDTLIWRRSRNNFKRRKKYNFLRQRRQRYCRLKWSRRRIRSVLRRRISLLLIKRQDHAIHQIVHIHRQTSHCIRDVFHSFILNNHWNNLRRIRLRNQLVNLRFFIFFFRFSLHFFYQCRRSIIFKFCLANILHHSLRFDKR